VAATQPAFTLGENSLRPLPVLSDQLGCAFLPAVGVIEPLSALIWSSYDFCAAPFAMFKSASASFSGLSLFWYAVSALASAVALSFSTALNWAGVPRYQRQRPWPHVGCGACGFVPAAARFRFAAAQMSPLNSELLPAVTPTEIHAATFLDRAHLPDDTQPTKAFSAPVVDTTRCHDGSP
jgi:hypothetical protein